MVFGSGNIRLSPRGAGSCPLLKGVVFPKLRQGAFVKLRIVSLSNYGFTAIVALSKEQTARVELPVDRIRVGDDITVKVETVEPLKLSFLMTLNSQNKKNDL